jgi:hypothetical protein
VTSDRQRKEESKKERGTRKEYQRMKGEEKILQT